MEEAQGMLEEGPTKQVRIGAYPLEARGKKGKTEGRARGR